MPRPPSIHPTDIELQILNVLWGSPSEPMDLGKICAELRRHRSIATSTVATVLNVMLKKGLVRRRKGPPYLWSARAEQEATQRGMLRKLAEIGYANSPDLMVSHLLQDERWDERQREAIRHLIQEHDGD